jgi:UDP-glucuronate decarboxylase
LEALDVPRTSLITGAAGFLGSHLADRLLARGETVIGFDNLQTGSRDNLRHLEGHDRFTLIEGDIVDGLPGAKVDEIYNLACAASPVRYQADPVHTFRTNVIGMLNVLDKARSDGSRVFQASTSEVYGNPHIHPQPETYHGNVNPIGPRACYDEGKRGAETLCFDYRRVYGLDVRVVRIFNTYGPRMHVDDGRVVSNLIVQALRGEPMTIFGDGSQTRSFCYVDDLLNGFLGVMDLPNAPEGPVNIGNDGEFTIRELAELVIELTGSKSALSALPLPQDDPLQRKPDLTLARNLFGFAAQVPLREGLARTIEHFRQAK